MKVSVLGLGKLGLCTAACFAAAGYAVYGYDVDERLRGELKAGCCPIDETGLQILLEKARLNLEIVDSCAEAISNSEVSLIIVPTPSMPDGSFSCDCVVAALEEIASTLATKETFHVIDVVSTVMPGSCDQVFKPLLERLTGKKCGRDFGLVYNPEFIALGSVIGNFLNPDLVLIGASDLTSGDLLAGLYRSTCTSNPAVAVMSLINAEITKISLNCYVTMKISYANSLAHICEMVPGADIDVVTSAIGADSRVGAKYLRGGLGFGGPCFPRDNVAFQRFAERYGREAPLGKAVVEINRGVPHRLFQHLIMNVAPAAKVALLGISYKAETHVVEESQSIMLAQLLMKGGFHVALHDPMALAAAKNVLKDGVAYEADPYQAVSGAAAIVLLTDWPLYRDLDWNRIASLAAPTPVVIDCWRIQKGRNLPGFTYLPIGVGSPAPEAS